MRIQPQMIKYLDQLDKKMGKEYFESHVFLHFLLFLSNDPSLTVIRPLEPRGIDSHLSKALKTKTPQQNLNLKN